MRSVHAVTRRHGNLIRTMLPALILSAVFTVTMSVTDLMPSAGGQPNYVATDDNGFVQTEARCERPQSPVAFGRTQQSLIAICGQGSDRFEYRGVRLSDGAVLTADAVEQRDNEFVAESERLTYTFSAKELAITSGDEVIRT